MQIPEFSPELLKILIPAIFTLLGVLLGNYLTYRNSYNLFTKQKTFDNQRISFSRIMSLKIPWTQAIHTNIEAKLLTEFYETRYLLFSHDEEDLIESKKQYERALLLIKDISREQKEVFETLGLIQTCFKVDKELQIAIDDMFNYESIDVSPFPKNFKTINELDEYLKKQSTSIHPLIKREYRDKFDNLIAILKPRLISSK
ncbi:hypothetical protein ACHRVK_16415 [Flavobacterium plurextorum]|uniref:hypothetical protein n=1 Tax=Flavobacterium plurextorum TaxID=1114867 RepID=UPI0037573F92